MPRSASASRRARPGRSTSGPPGRRCSTTCTPATPAGRSSCASRTPTRRAARSRSRRTSSTGCTGSGSTGTRAPRSPARRRAARTRRTARCSASRSTPRRPSGCSPRTRPIPATARPRSSRPTARPRRRPRQPPRYVGRCAALTAGRARRARGRGPSRRAIRFRVGTGVVAFDDIVRGQVEIDVGEPRRRLRHRPRRRHAALPLHGRRRRRGDGDQPRHPRRGPPLEHAQAHPPVPGARPRGAALRPPAADPQPRPDEDEQAQEPDRGRRLHRPGLHPRGARQLPRAPRLVDRAPRRRSSRSTRSSSGSTSTAVHKGGAVFDRERLEWLNGQWIRRLEPDDLVDRLRPFVDGRAGRRPDRLHAAATTSSRRCCRSSRSACRRSARSASSSGSCGSTTSRSTRRCSSRSAGTRPRRARRSPRPARSSPTRGAVAFEADELEPPLRALAEARGWKAGDLFMAIRVAVTGRTATPPLFDTLVALGRERTLERLARAVAVLEEGSVPR